MFPDDNVAKSFAVGKTKAAYVIEGAIGPYLRQQQISILQENKFAIVIDESNNIKGKKQLDILVRYFVENYDVITEFYRSIFLTIDREEVLRVLSSETTKFPSICSSDKLSSEILSCLEADDIPFENVIAVNRDGPVVMDATLKKLKEKMPNMLDIGSCNLHGVHNATSKAVESSFPFSPVEMVLEIQSYFKHQALRKEELNVIALLFESEETSVNLGSFGSTRFLSLYHSLVNILDNFCVIKTYFLHYLSKKPSRVVSQERYKKICGYLSDSLTEALLIFLKDALEIIHKFELFLQKQEPIGHSFFFEMRELLATLVGRCCSPLTAEKVRKGKFDIIDSIEHYLLKRTNVGPAKNIASDDDLKKIYPVARSFYVSLVRNLIHYFHLDDKDILKLWKCLSSQSLLAREASQHKKSLKNFEGLLELLRVSGIMPEGSCSVARDEYVKFLSDPDVTKLKTEFQSTAESNLFRIDHFYREVFKITDSNGTPRYSQLSAVVRVTLCIQPHSADIERNFSVNSHILSSVTNRMSEQLLNDRKRIVSHLKNVGGCVHMHIPNELCKMAAEAHKKIKQLREKERKLKQRNDTIRRHQNALSAIQRKRLEDLKASVMETESAERDAQHCEVLCATTLKLAKKYLRRARLQRLNMKKSFKRRRAAIEKMDHYMLSSIATDQPVISSHEATFAGPASQPASSLETATTQPTVPVQAAAYRQLQSRRQSRRRHCNRPTCDLISRSDISRTSQPASSLETAVQPATSVETAENYGLFLFSHDGLNSFMLLLADNILFFHSLLFSFSALSMYMYFYRSKG
jgi:hypothetical protein